MTLPSPVVAPPRPITELERDRLDDTLANLVELAYRITGDVSTDRVDWRNVVQSLDTLGSQVAAAQRLASGFAAVREAGE